MAIDFVAASSEYLDALAEFADLRGNNALGEASFSFWIKTTQISGASNDWQSPHVTGFENVGGDDCMWGGIDNGGASASKIWASWAQGQNWNLKSVTPINDDVWHHIVQTMTLAGAIAQVFVDGVLDNSRSGGTATVPSNTFTELGRLTGATSYYFDGLLDDIRIYNRVLGANEVAAMYAQRGADPNFEGCVSRWRLDEGAPGVVVVGAGVVKDDVGGNNCTPSATPTFEESVVGARRVA